jgi:hypothetical protein
MKLNLKSLSKESFDLENRRVTHQKCSHENKGLLRIKSNSNELTFRYYPPCGKKGIPNYFQMVQPGADKIHCHQ